MNAPDSIDHLDREQVFLLFANFCGDAARTAAALNISPVAVLRLAEESGWLKKLEPIIALSKSQRPGDFERSVNRATNLVQAIRFRNILERTIKKLTGYTEEEFTDLIEEAKLNKDGVVVSTKLSTRALADLASALEKAHAMSYHALNDTAPERAKRAALAPDDGDSTIDIHAKLAAACAAAGMSNSPRDLLFDAQLAQGEAIAHEASKKSAKAARTEQDPLNDDDH